MTTPEERRQAAVDRVAARRSEKPETVVETVAPDSELVAAPDSEPPREDPSQELETYHQRLDVIDERLVVIESTLADLVGLMGTAPGAPRGRRVGGPSSGNTAL